MGVPTLAMPSTTSTPRTIGSLALKTQPGRILRRHGKMATSLAASCSSILACTIRVLGGWVGWVGWVGGWGG